MTTVVDFTVHGTSLSDTIKMSNFFPQAYASTLISRAYGYGGNDTIIGYTGFESIYGGDGNDILESARFIYGGEGDDKIKGSNNGFINDLNGDGGNDTIIGSGGLDFIYGGTGDDTLDGGYGRDNIYGEGGNDNIRGGYLTDFLYGGADDDRFLLTGSGFIDYFFDQPGGETSTFESGDGDFYAGGTGFDLLVADKHKHTLVLENASDLLDWDNSIEGIDGGNFFDFRVLVFGSGVQDFSSVFLRNTTLVMYSGDDVVIGSSANQLYDSDDNGIDDTLNSATGNDKIDGGFGVDTVIFKGNRSDYSIYYLGSGQFQVWDQVGANGNTGRDILVNFEKLQFLDQILDIGLYAQDDSAIGGTAVNGVAGTVSESASNGAGVGIDLSATPAAGLLSFVPSAYFDSNITFSLLDSAGGRFSIDSSTGIVTVADASLLDYESAPFIGGSDVDRGFTIWVNSSVSGIDVPNFFTILVTDTEENVAPNSPVDIDAASNAVNEGAANGTYTGVQAFASDPNTADIVTLSLADDAGGRFSIGTNGKIYVANGVALDFETQPSWDVTVRATDAAGAFTDSVFAISLNNVAGDTPTDSDGAANSVIEGAANGTYTGLTGSLVSPTGSPVTYSLISNAFGRFQINSTTGAVTVANGALLDFETQSAWNITVGATDGKITGSKVFTINLVDVAGDTPTDSDGAANSVIEGAANGTYTGLTGSLVSPTGSPVTYSLISSAFGRFQINSTTGAVTVANGALLDFETQSAWNITVGATDGKITGSKVFTINLVNGNDAPGTVSDTDGADNIVNEGAAVGTVVGIAAQAIDPNGDLLTYSLVNNAGGRFAINASTGVITVANGALLDFESQSAWDVTVRATDGGGLYSEQLFTIDIADIVWDTLVDSDLATNDIVDENAATDTYTGVTAAAVSPSGEPVTYSLTDNAAGRFQIDASTGAIAVLDGNLLDFEAQNAWNVTVSASDGSTAHEQVFTIYLNDQASESWFGTSEDDIFTINRLGEWVLNGLGGNDVLTATDGQHITFIGGDGNDTLTGRNGNDVFQYDGTANGLDAVVGGDGYDVIQAIAGNTTIGLSAVSGIEEINGGGFADVILQLGAGNDVIDSNVTALTGIATIRAGAGNDSIIGTSADESIFGEDGNDLILGGGGGDALNGGNGVDTVSYAGSWDALTINLATNAVSGGDATGDTITGFENVTGSDFNDSITGSTGANVISAGAGNDTLDGGAGADTLVGGLGNDTYTVDNAGDVVTENASEGTDTVQTGLASYTLGTNVENLVYTGTTAFTGTGNTLNNALTGGAGNDTLSGGDGNDTLTGLGGSDTLNGGAGNDTLNGGAGTDTLVGGLGDDIYVVDVATDIVTEAANAGTDTVQTGLASYTLGTNVENLVYTGTTAFTGTGNTLNNAITGGVGNDTLSGGDGNDTLNGGAGNDTLNGGAGTDTLVGGSGDDIYVVDVATDIVTEGLNQGTDTVQTGLASYTLGANVENLVYTGTVAFTGTGNALNNAITGGAGNDTLSGGDGNDTLNGGAGNDTLNGGAGTDTLVGGLGDDIYVVDVATDIVTEAANAGTDTVQTGLASYTLGTNVENLVYTGTVAFTGTGNALNNAITGGAGNDTLDGGAGTDTLAGGAGNDTYVVDVATDIVTEAANAGTDTVRTGLVSYTLGTNVENLVYTGTAAFTGTGNALNNAITGGAGNDILSGGAGNDTINGGAGNDTLEGGAGSDTLDGGTGNDRFVYSAAGFGSDSISGFAGGTGIGDVLSFRTSVFADWQALLSKSAQVGSDTVITLNTLDKVTLKNFALSNFKSDDATFYT